MLIVAFLALERKISVRANRDELIQKGILLPDNLSAIPEPGKVSLIISISFLLPWSWTKFFFDWNWINFR
jgi:hypothetical protein